jgi:zinc D-Ala-D-Ala carboxypeptidase
VNFRYFKIDDFACACGKCQNLINEDFVGRLDDLRHRCGFPLIVSSGYRCPAHNQAVSTTGPNGPHTTGKAADLKVDRAQARTVIGVASAMGFAGLGVNQKGSGRFIHVDDMDRPVATVWSY